jgi:SAM-dependent methyltransferase
LVAVLIEFALPLISKTIRDRFPIIEQYVRDRTVMDLGCVDSRAARHDAAARIEYKANLLHKRIAEVNRDVLTMDLGKRFDTIIAGEIIEHLENPGKFLRNMHKHLNPGGTLIISTPNPFYAGSAWKIWRYGEPAVHEEHMGWQDPTTLGQLLKRTGFEPFAGYWIQPHPAILKTWKRLLRPYFSHTFMLLARAA